MSSLTIAWEYLTGYVVATDPANRRRAEWPPHPARVFMAMAAAWFETVPGSPGDETDFRQHEAEGQALRWIEALDEPELWLLPDAAASERTEVTVYVPVNDKAGPSSATLQCAPALTRSKQSRTFPRLYVGGAPCVLHWPVAEAAESHREALVRLCAKVTRIGHSSSLVRMWVAEHDTDNELARLERWRPEVGIPAVQCRRISAGLLDDLPLQTQIPRIETFAELVWRIEDAQVACDKAKAGGDARARRDANGSLQRAKQAFEQAAGEPFRKKSVSPPPRLRPKIGLWTGYSRRRSDGEGPHVGGTLFDRDLLILTHAGGPSLPVTAALTVSTALRNVIMKRSGIQPVPDWVSGHKTDGSPDKSGGGHLAVLPLPFVGREHADGHLLGMALAFPRAVGRSERGRVLGPLLVNERGEPKDVVLTLGALGTWTLRKRDWSEERWALQPETWAGRQAGSISWASVTPVVLDRFPKADRGDPRQRVAWEEEVRAIIAHACTRINLPHPIHIDVDTTSWQLGAPRAVTKRRRLRNGPPPGSHATAPLGDGFPDYPAKGTGSPRPQVHVFLQFAEPVRGPMLLGVGRYRGYGLLKPLEGPR